MKSSLRLKLEQLTARLAELEHLLAAPETARDMDRYRSLSKEHAEIGPVASRIKPRHALQLRAQNRGSVSCVEK